MAWFSGKVSLGNLDLAGALNKVSESAKNIGKNFDSALGLEEISDSTATTSCRSNETSGLWPSATNGKTLFDPVVASWGKEVRIVLLSLLENLNHLLWWKNNLPSPIGRLNLE